MNDVSFIANQIFYYICYTEACNEFGEPISASLGPSNTVLVEEMSQRGGNAVAISTGQRFEPRTSSSTDEVLPLIQLGNTNTGNVLVPIQNNSTI